MIPPLRLVPVGPTLPSSTTPEGLDGTPFVLPQPGNRPAIGKTLPLDGPVTSEAGAATGSVERPSSGSADPAAAPADTPFTDTLPLGTLPRDTPPLPSKPKPKHSAVRPQAQAPVQPDGIGRDVALPAQHADSAAKTESDVDPTPSPSPLESGTFSAVVAMLLNGIEPAPRPTTPGPTTPPLPRPGFPAPVGRSMVPAETERTSDSAPPAPVEARGATDPVLAPIAEPLHAHAFHPADAAALARAERVSTDTPAGIAVAALAPAARQPHPVEDCPITPAEPIATLSAVAPPMSDARAGGNVGGDTGGEQPSPSPDRSTPPPLLERVEFDAGPDGVTRLRLVHESVGRLLVTLEAGERTDVRIASDDAAVRQTLADALPTLRRLSDDRQLSLGTLEVAQPGVGADGRGRDASSDRRPAPPPAPASAPARAPIAPPRTVAPTLAGRSAGLFA